MSNPNRRACRSTRIYFALSLTIMLLAVVPSSGDESQVGRSAGDPDLPTIEVVEVSAAPKIDGKLDDACWKSAKASPNFIGEYGFPVATKTSFQICQKDEVLYVAVRAAYDPAGPPKEPPNNTKVHDGSFWQGEEIEVFFDPDNDQTPGYYQFALTPQGTTGDFFNPQPRDPEPRWEPKYDVKLHWTPKEWTVEWAIPLAAFDRTATVFDNIGLNVFRLYKGTSCWSPNRSEGFHSPHKFGEARGIKGKDVKTFPAGRFRSPHVFVNDRVIRAKAERSLIPAKTPALVAGPTTKLTRSGVQIAFEVNTETDVAVWIEDAKGERVRHLAAGRLGENPPSPLKKNSLAQTVVWNYRDDSGQKVLAGNYAVRVGVGSQASLDRVIGWNPTPKNVQGVTLDSKGNVYVVGGVRDEWVELQRFDRQGEFAGMLFPPPASVPPEKLKGLNIIDLGPDGQVRWGSDRPAALQHATDRRQWLKRCRNVRRPDILTYDSNLEKAHLPTIVGVAKYIFVVRR